MSTLSTPMNIPTAAARTGTTGTSGLFASGFSFNGRARLLRTIMPADAVERVEMAMVLGCALAMTLLLNALL